MFDLRSFSFDDLYECSTDIRKLGDIARDADDVARRIVTYIFEEFRAPDTGAAMCALVRIFRTRRLSCLDPDEAQIARSLDLGAKPDPLILSLRASRGIRPEWNDPRLSRSHRIIPLASMTPLARTPTICNLVAQLGVPAGIFSPSNADRSVPPTTAELDAEAYVNFFHVENAPGSPFVPDQTEFVEPYGVKSELGCGGVLPRRDMFVMILFSTVRLPRSTAELFRALAASIGLALLTPGRDVSSIEACVRAYDRVVRHHMLAIVEQHRQLRRDAERLTALVAARERFEALVENSADFVAISQLDGRGVYLNPAGRRLVGLSPTFDVTSTTLSDFHPAAFRQDVDDILMTTRRKGRWAGETWFRNWISGTMVPVSIDHFTIRDSATRQVLGLGSVARDISERRHAEEERDRLLKSLEETKNQALSASRAKDEFLAVLGHELRNPLSPIMTALELMKLRGQKSSEQEIIERQALYLTRLVDDLLDVSRIVRGKIDIRMEPVELATVIDRAVEITCPLLQERRQRLAVEGADRGMIVKGDVVRLAQVLSNLLHNASKYSPTGSTIRLSAERSGQLIRLSVRDEGVGIPADRLDSIFESFVQYGRRPGEPLAAGLGLGLTIARSLTALHGGVVYARSDGPGKGSEFVVELPLATEAAAPSAPEPEPAVKPTSTRQAARAGARKRIMVVDDNQDAAKLLADLLTELGHTVRVANDGPSGLAVAREFAPEVALLDLGLPVMDGYELARRLREVGNEVRLVAVTGYGHESARQQSVEAGFSAHLVKPVAVSTLMDVVGS